MNSGNFTFLCRTKIGFGMNSLEHLAFDLSCMGCEKPLVILDREAHQTFRSKLLVRAFKESGMTLGICPPIDTGSPVGSDLEILKTVYQIYTDNGFDAIIALGTAEVVDLAKALNMAVALGPNSLNDPRALDRITQPLTPMVYIPTGMGNGTETRGSFLFNACTHDSPFLSPELAVIDPDILTPDTSETLINAGLTCLSACCEAHALSNIPPARAYAATAITLIMENLLPLLKGLKGTGARPDKKTARHHMACLTQASVITGVILANCGHLPGFRLGRIVADHCSATPAQASAILLPAILEFFAGSTPALGRLALPLTDLSTFSQTPGPQRPALAIHKIQTLVNDLYMISLGAVPRTLKDAGMDRTAIDALVESQFFNAEEPEKGSVKMDPEQAQVILVRAFEGRPMNQA